jgi:CRISPR system Cascade subunit CasC
MLIQIHILQNYAPSNLNRDQSGSPKDAVFGDRKRGRISSQCLKRSIRLSPAFANEFAGDGLLGSRTQQLPTLLKRALEELGATEDEVKAIVLRAAEIGRESTKGRQEEGDEEETTGEGPAVEATAGETKQLIFLDRGHELPQMAEKLLAQCRKAGVKDFSNPKKVKIADITKALGSSVPRSVDIALFGRMTTSEAFKDVQAASQVAHAISTHVVEQEFDYYTAMDDLKPEDEPGADMIGDIEFNSCTYYKYLNVHWEELLKNLGGPENATVARRAVAALLKAAALSQPSGKQNSFAAFSLPDFILVELSPSNLAVSYANAFLRPARAFGARTLMETSIDQLDEHVRNLTQRYSLEAARAYLSVEGRDFMAMKSQPSLGDLQDWVLAQLPQ